MASVFRRKDRNGKPLPLWAYHYTDHLGKRRTGTGTKDKSVTRAIAEHLESQAKLVQAGLKDARDLTAEKAGRLPMETHVEDYHLALIDKGDTEKHARHTAGAILRVLTDARFEKLSQVTQEALQAALRRLKDRTSSRTANHALGAVKGFLRWCDGTGKIGSLPRWLSSVKPYNEAVDRRRIRRALTTNELAHLLESTEQAPPIRFYGHTKSKHHAIEITGPERAALYRIAATTGLRANEIRTLEPNAFKLDGDDPHVIVRAAYSKHRREDHQPIRRSDAEWLRTWLVGREGHVVMVPNRTAEILRGDLERAGISYETEDGVVDFHSLRATYITLLAQSGIDPKRLQKLARHSTITLTMDRYVKTTERDIRKALEGDIETPN
jgi:integrase/recombinase XerD